MTRTGAQVKLPLGDLGPVTYDAASESLEFALQDIGGVIDALRATAKDLDAAWNQTIGGESARKS